MFDGIASQLAPWAAAVFTVTASASTVTDEPGRILGRQADAIIDAAGSQDGLRTPSVFSANATGSSVTTTLDMGVNVDVSPVPESSTLALLAAGLLVVGVRLRRQVS